MARIAFTWELGGGLGHLVAYRAVIDRLIESGHEVWFVARDVDRARATYALRPVSVVAAPHDVTPLERRIRPPESYPDILFNCGFHDVQALRTRMEAWHGILTRIAPALLIADCSPTALLMNRVLRLPVIAAGNGFFMPPDEVPVPRYRHWLPSDRAALERSERRVTDNANLALAAFGASPVQSVRAMLASDGQFLRTFKEFDPYPQRGPTDYLGTFPRLGFGAPPVWPTGDGPRVVAYLQRANTTPAVLAALKRHKARVCLYAPQVPPERIAAYGPQPIHSSAEPLDLVAAIQQCEAVVSNGNANTVMQAALLGKPQLALPTSLERLLNSRSIEALGAGLYVPQSRPRDVTGKLGAILKRGVFRRQAEQFAATYAGTSGEQQTERMLAQIDHLLGL